MSYIKRLKLKGFKSFANPTVIEYEKNFNTIVGANGSGKSNVFDALCFVLGRMSSKGLRADKLGNLVFNGGKSLKPAKDAEVSIFLANENKEFMDVDLDEIKISRIVKKSGQSQYLLNNNKVTRTEIVEILRRASIDPDGYNIILQGDIQKIVNMSTAERRDLIGEISNISGYEEKRDKGLKKLEKVDTDLKEADLLMEEKTKYLKDLKSEKDLAEKYHKVKDDLRFNNFLLIKSKLIKNSDLKKKKEETLELNEKNLKVYKEKLETVESKIKSIEDEIINLEKSIEIKSRNEFIEVTNKVTSLDLEVQKLNEKKSEYKLQVEELKSKNIGVKENISKNKSEIKLIDDEIKTHEKEIKVFESEIAGFNAKLSKLKLNLSGDGFEEIEKLDLLIDELNKKKQNKFLIKQDNSIQVEKLNNKLEHFQMDLDKISSHGLENKSQVKQLEVLRKELKHLIVDVSSKSNKNSETAAKLNNLQKEFSTLVEDSSKLRMKVESSKDLISTNKAVDTISNLKIQDSEIHGTVSELAFVPEKYSMALETLSGKALFNIVVETDSTAVKYINYLKEKRVGNATFLPLNKVHAKFRLDDRVLNKKGVIDYALNLVKFDKRYENIFHLIFSDAIVIEKIEDARAIGIGEYKMVTLDGDLVTKSGAMSGGFKSRKRGLGAFKDDTSVQKLANIDSKISSLQATISHLKSEKEDSERNIYDLRQRKMEVEGDILKLEKILSIEGKDVDSIKSEMEAIYSDKTVIESSLKKQEKDIREIEQEIENLHTKKNKLKQGSFSNNSVFKDISVIEEKRDKLKENLMNIINKRDTRNIQLNNVLKPEILNLEKIFKEGEEALEKIKLMISELDSNLKSLNLELKEFQKKEKELSKDHKQFIEQRDSLREDKKKQEAKYNVEFERFDKIKERSSQIRYSIGEFETMTQTLTDELELLYENLKFEFTETDNEEETTEDINKKIEEFVTLIENKIENSNIDVKELQNKVNNLKSRLNSFGSINMKAVEIYDKLNDEFSKLLEKREVLTSEKEDILSFIAELDQKKKDRFMETFVQLKRNFIDFYSKLSTKGDAELNIENEEDIFNSGVEIKVRLSKTNYLDIKSLSGGEKTITAVAFIFAVQEFNPASFYIFDEIDAALDIMNSEKLGKLIQASSHKAQYIVVSHSEYLIQSSSAIYGVTMDKNKISGVVSLDLSDMKDYVDNAESSSS